MQKTILLLVLLCLTITAEAQTYTIKGSVSDTVNLNPLQNAAITLLRAEDSVLATFARAKSDGTFALEVKDKGKYLLMVTFPSFADYIDVINVTKPATNVGELPMVSRTHLLKEFVLTDQYAAIKVKGDTIEYVADSFKVRDNATVESLLKKLPGIQVDKDGKIMAQGTEVQKLLVDGEEFFTDDPAVVSKSLGAKAVNKVQVYDKKSDEAEFTGIDDGERTKTINLELKENMKKGYFGKIKAGGGAGDLQNYFENQAMINSFKGKRKLSAFGIMANTGTIGLGWEDQDKFNAGGGNTSVGDDGSITTYYSSDDFESWDGQYNGRGYPRAWTGGLHYSNKWNEDKHHVAGNYRYAKQDIETVNNTITEKILQDSALYETQTSNSFKTGNRNRISALYELKVDSLSDIRVNATVNRTENLRNSETNQNTRDASGNEINSNNTKTRSEGLTTQINSSLMYRKKFKKDRRTITVSLSENYQERTGDILLNSLIKYANLSARNDTFDQKKRNEDKNISLTGYASYTEPLSKYLSLSLSYRLNVTNNSAERNTFSKSAPFSDSYDQLDSIFSSNYAFNITTHTGSTFLRYSYKKKLNASIGGSIARANFLQDNLMTDTSRRYSFTNFFPSASIRYNIQKQTRVSLSYNGRTRQPSLEQIQPLQNNIDPLNQSIGNPGLNQEFSHSINANFSDYKVFSGRHIWMYAYFNVVDNAISRSQTIDSLGRTTYQYVNLDGNYNGSASINVGKRIRKLNTQIGGRTRVSLSKANNLVNGVKNASNYNSYSVNAYANYESKDEKIMVSLGVGPSYNDNSSSISTQVTSYWSVNYNFDASYEFPFKLRIGSDFDWSVREQTAVFDRNNNVFRWNAYISQRFLKNDQLELRASVFDILNQNLGFTRNASNNYVTEQSYNTIRRYGMLSLTWNFTKTAMGATPENDAASMIIKKN
ncbi:MAG: TonB-dependent receptor [Flavipsychrobacter sp.]